MKTKVDNYRLLVDGNLYKRIIYLSIPTIIGMLITSVYNAVDTYFVSSFGESAIAGVSVVLSYMTLLQAVGFFFGHGSGNFISKSLGAKKTERASEMSITGLTYSFTVGVIIMILSLIFIDPFVALLSNDTMTEYTKGYFFYIILATPFITSSFTLNNQLRFQGKAIYGMVGLGVGAVLNIILDPIFIRIFNGVQGASFATMICQIIGFFILLGATFLSDNIRLNPKKIRVNKFYAKEIIRGGAPSLLRQGMMSVTTIILTLLVKPYGDYALAGVSIAQKISQILFSVLLGFCQGFQPVCGFNYGAKKYDRVIKSFVFTTIVSTGYMLIAGVVCVAFAKPLVSIFNTTSNLSADNMQRALTLGEQVLRLQGFAFPLMGLYVTSNMMMQNIGKSFRASFIALCRQGIVFLPLVFIMERALKLRGIVLTQPIADVLSFIVSIPILVTVIKEIKREERANAMPINE